MQKSDLTVITRDGQATEMLALAEEYVIEESERRGLPDFKFFTAMSEEELEVKVRQWRDAEVTDNPNIEGILVMSPTVSDDGIWRTVVNFLVFEESVDPWQ